MSAKHRRQPYMPDSDLGKRNWMERFITQLESDPAKYGFDDPYMFEYYQRTIRTFIKAADTTLNKGRRSPCVVVEKNRARKEAVNMCRNFAMRMKWDSSISEADKQSLGILTLGSESLPEKAKVPTGFLTGTEGFPLLAVQSSPNGGHVIRYMEHGSLGGSSKAKPKGVSHLLLFAAIGEQPNMGRTHARLLGAYTKRPFEVMYPMDCGLEGLYVTYYGRWLTTRGDMSPWSKGVSKIIGETQLSLGGCGFAHLFGKEGFVDAVPQLPEGVERGGVDAVRIDDERQLLESGSDESDELLTQLGQRMLEAATAGLLTVV